MDEWVSDTPLISRSGPYSIVSTGNRYVATYNKGLLLVTSEEKEAIAACENHFKSKGEVK